MRIRSLIFTALSLVLCSCVQPEYEAPRDVTIKQVDLQLDVDCSKLSDSTIRIDNEDEPAHWMECRVRLKSNPRAEERWVYFLSWHALDENGDWLSFELDRPNQQTPRTAGEYVGDLFIGTLYPGAWLLYDRRMLIPHRAVTWRWRVFWCEDVNVNEESSFEDQCDNPAGEYYRDYPLKPTDARGSRVVGGYETVPVKQSP